VPVRKKRVAAVTVKKALPTPTMTVVPQQAAGASGVVNTFSSLPVNIDANFADGPGRYKCELVDAQGNHINTIYDKQVAFEKESWISWDGTNDQGKLMPYGRYYAILSKDGHLIQKMFLNYTAPN
jgi:flagellar hook assembly protein FlgD